MRLTLALIMLMVVFTISAHALPAELVYLDEAMPGVVWDARYAQDGNFTGRAVDGYTANRVVLTHALVDALKKARDVALAKGYDLLIWDGVRPQRAVDDFIRWGEIPENNLTKAKYYPQYTRPELFDGFIAKRSGHSRGCAVDLTLTKDGEPLDMGGIFDFLDPISYHGSQGITKEQTANRNLLKDIMIHSGFEPYSHEWWHYSLVEEPFPNTYFDFVISESSF